ncbi:hypothetical protein [Pantoea sp. Cy-640]|uniref:hypothetical protein n=1 Tax=Pantoea sp. Cy-640 TaxID=2608353 RepID=UPI0014195003|nr:hypothetical protein [Pantoea sp. Cy-640]
MPVKTILTNRKLREKSPSSPYSTPESVVVENNALTIPAPAVPVPGVPVGPGDQVKQDADKKIAAGLKGTIKDLGDALDKATQCSFG